MPYIYSFAAATYHHDYTIMRGLIMDFPNDTAVKNIGDQYMFGLPYSSILFIIIRNAIKVCICLQARDGTIFIQENILMAGKESP